MRSLPGRAASCAGVPAGRAGRNRRGAAAAVLVLTASTVTGCAAGQHAQTAEERPTIDGYYGQAGGLSLGGVSLAAPTGNAWPYGASVPMSLYVTNTTARPDTLVGVSSPNFSGWTVESSSAVSASSAASASTTPSGATPSSATSGLQGGSGSPQPIPPHSALSLGLAAVNHATGKGSGKVLVLTGLKAQLWPGAEVPVTLKFQHAGTKRISVPVQITSTAASESVSGTNTSGAAGIQG